MALILISLQSRSTRKCKQGQMCLSICPVVPNRGPKSVVTYRCKVTHWTVAAVGNDSQMSSVVEKGCIKAQLRIAVGRMIRKANISAVLALVTVEGSSTVAIGDFNNNPKRLRPGKRSTPTLLVRERVNRRVDHRFAWLDHRRRELRSIWRIRVALSLEANASRFFESTTSWLTIEMN